MNDDTRIRDTQASLTRVIRVLERQREEIETAARNVDDDDVSEAMITWKICPTLAHAVNARLSTALAELDELLAILNDIATLRVEEVERRWRALHARVSA